ncbi:MAG: serine/threonine-protein kinase [Deltaproteobacteria bacterium]|nr:serine/threonine-protein kinase [Deltaproteobacteria bacterium]
MTEADPLVGKILAQRYRVVERLAEGAMGVVYRGERLTLNRNVAIKFLHPAVAQQEALRKRFEIEAQAMGRLSHPNCVSVIDFGVDDVPYLVMEYVQGKNLRALLNDGGFNTTRALSIGRQLLTALVHAHAQGIIHRDIKPENLLLQQSAGLDDHLRVLDFGLAKLMDNGAGLTAGFALGTPNYMAPEQIQEGGIDARADLYAAGVVLFELLTGVQPFAADSVGEVLRRHLQVTAPRLREAAPARGFSPALDDVVFCAMAKRPSERFPTAAQMLAALEQVPEMQTETVPKPRVTSPSVPTRLPPPPTKGKPLPAPPAPDPTVWDQAAAPPASEAPTPAASAADDNATMLLSEDDNLAAAVAIPLKERAKRKGAAWWSAIVATGAAAQSRWSALSLRLRLGLAAGVALLFLLLIGLGLRGDATARKADETTPKRDVAATAPSSKPASDVKPKPAAKAEPAQAPVADRQAPAPRAHTSETTTRTTTTRTERRTVTTRRASSAERWGTRWKQ